MYLCDVFMWCIYVMYLRDVFMWCRHRIDSRSLKSSGRRTENRHMRERLKSISSLSKPASLVWTRPTIGYSGWTTRWLLEPPKHLITCLPYQHTCKPIFELYYWHAFWSNVLGPVTRPEFHCLLVCPVLHQYIRFECVSRYSHW